MDKYAKSKIKLKILQMFSWVPDRPMICLQYRMKTGRKLDLDNPVRYTEKLQWYKLFYKDPQMAKCADKYEVREYVKSKGLENILNRCYGVYDSEQDIDFSKLPDQFVIKATNGASGIGIYLCDDKNRLNEESVRRELQFWLKPHRKGGGREWVYDVYAPRLIVEDYLRPGKNEQSLVDYKFFCFHGEPYCLYVMNERFSSGGVRQNILDLDYKVMPYMREKIEPIRTPLVKPEHFDEMIQMSRILSEDFPYVRVDFYDIDGKIYFGEMTFFPESGYYDFEPDAFDYILGKKFILPEPFGEKWGRLSEN